MFESYVGVTPGCQPKVGNKAKLAAAMEGGNTFLKGGSVSLTGWEGSKTEVKRGKSDEEECGVLKMFLGLSKHKTFLSNFIPTTS